MSDLTYLVYILPLAAIAYTLYRAYIHLPLLTLPAPEADAPRARFSFAAGLYPLTGRDRLAAMLITLVYAAVAFIGLGDASAPQSFCDFADRGRYADIDLGEDTVISRIDYYCDLKTGSYYLQYSDDGVTFTDAGTLEQAYTDLFKWREAEISEDAPASARYIRLIADSPLRLGEIAIYGEYGGRIDPDTMTFSQGVAPLFDEQDTVPAEFSYLNSTYFDEIYHARTAYENLEGIYPYEISHPPLGKLILSLGIAIFGMDPFGWRFMGTLFGALMLPVLYVFLKRLFGESSIAACGTVIFAFDFMHFVQTRIATIDTYAVFFILLMYLFMWRWAAGGRLWDLALSGLFFGLGAASKWTCIYAGAGLGVIWLLHWLFRRGEEGFGRKLAENILFCLGFFVLLPCLIYYLSYIPYGQARGLGGLSMLTSREYAEIVWDNQKYMLNYHSGLVATHPYSSRWYQWIVDGRPILYYLNYFDDGSRSSIGAFLSPLLCWSGLFSMVGVGVLAVKKRDGRALFILIGYLAQLLPWVLISRLTFEYHYFPSALFLLLALCYIWSESKNAGFFRWKRGMFIFTGLSVGLFALFYPVLSGVRTAGWYCTYLLKWLPSWPF